jgi:hypothetical protein
LGQLSFIVLLALAPTAVLAQEADTVYVNGIVHSELTMSPTIAPSMASYEFFAVLSISLISSFVHTHIRVATLLITGHSAVEEPDFTWTFGGSTSYRNDRLSCLSCLNINTGRPDA